MPAWATSLLAPLITLVGGCITFALAHFQRSNAPDIVANDEAKKLQAEKDRLNDDAEKALQTGDLTQVRKDVAD